MSGFLMTSTKRKEKKKKYPQSRLIPKVLLNKTINFTRFIRFLVAYAEQPQWSEHRIQLIDILDNRLRTTLLFGVDQSLSHTRTHAAQGWCVLFPLYEVQNAGIDSDFLIAFEAGGN